MKYLPRPRSTWQAAARAAALLVAAAACNACSKSPAEPAGSSHATAGATSPGGGASAAAHGRSHLAAEDAGRALARSAAVRDRAGAYRDTPDPREPDWDLDTSDPARDYVRRYALATRRYGDTLDCIEIRPSQDAGAQRRVEVKRAAGCPGGAGAQRDVFLVDVPGDRLTVDDPSKRDPLARWPDGSDPDGPANPTRSNDDMLEWKTPLHDAVRDLQLVAIRVQAYGRGSYPVVTIAGWHGKVQPTTAAADLESVADRLCKANGNAPLAIFGGLNRSTLLRIRCPAAARWDKL